MRELASREHIFMQDPLSSPTAAAVFAGEDDDEEVVTVAVEPSVGSRGEHLVFISDVAKAATVEDLKSFFSFCGAVGHIELHPQGELFQQGTVSFHSRAAAETALLLNQATIVDKPITVTKPQAEHADISLPEPSAIVYTTDAGLVRLQPFDGVEEPGPLPGSMPQNFSYAPSAAANDEKLGTLLALLNAGYQLGQTAIDYIAQTEAAQAAAAAARSAAALVSAKLLEVDEEHHITAKLKAFDEEHAISQTAKQTWDKAVETAEAGRQAAAPIAADAQRALQEAVETAAPVAAASAEAVTSKAEELKRLALDNLNAQLEDERNQQMLESARQSVTIGVENAKSWASSMFGTLQEAWDNASDAGRAEGESRSRAPAARASARLHSRARQAGNTADDEDFDRL